MGPLLPSPSFHKNPKQWMYVRKDGNSSGLLSAQHGHVLSVLPAAWKSAQAWGTFWKLGPREMLGTSAQA